MDLKIGKRKLIIKTAILSSAVSILVFCMASYYLYSYNRYKECLNNNAALWNFEEGMLQLVEGQNEVDGDVYTGNGMTIHINELGEIRYISDEYGGFKKLFKDNILQYVFVDDDLADFISYINPRVCLGGARKVKPEKKYEIRSDDEIYELKQLIKEGGEEYLSSSYLEFMEIRNQYIIIK